MIVGNPIIMILKAILNWFRLRRNYIANAVDKIPPEIKDALVAWYDPKKQGMTNFDVIEAYVEDFTTWRHLDSRGTAAVTPNKITITESFDTTNIVEDIEEPYSDISIYVTGVSEDVPLVVRDITGNKAIITKDGKYDFSKNSRFMGFAINKILSNINVVISLLPTSILKDFSGNKHDAYLYGFKGKLNSGIGIYKIDFSEITNINAFDNFERFNNKFIAKGTYKGNYEVFGQYTVDGIVKNKVTVKITGVSNISDKLVLQYGYITKNNRFVFKETFISKDGVYTYDINDVEISDENNIAQTIYNRLYFGAKVINDINLIVEEIPDYPNQLCYDGKSYAVAYNMPILTDYTVMAERTILDNSDIADWAFIAKRDYPAINGAFTFEKDIDDTSDNLRTISFGRTSVIYKPIKERSISYQTKNKYNGQDIIAGNVDDVDFLLIGAGILDTNLNLVKEKMRVAHGNILLFNRTLTEYEISWVKNNLMCSKPQEPNKDDILKSLVVHYNIGKQGSNSIKSTNTLTDYSGNNRNATCKNFNWANTQFVDDDKAMRNGFDVINATANKNAFDLYKYSRDNKDELAGQIGELKTEVAVLKATRPYQDALIQCDIRRVAEHADFNLWRRTCRMISGEVVLPNTPTVTGYASYNPCDCRSNSTQTPAA